MTKTSVSVNILSAATGSALSSVICGQQLFVYTEL